MSHENTGGESPPILRGSGERKLFTLRFAISTLMYLAKLAQSRGLKVTHYLEDLILKQKIKK